MPGRPKSGFNGAPDQAAPVGCSNHASSRVGEPDGRRLGHPLVVLRRGQHLVVRRGEQTPAAAASSINSPTSNSPAPVALLMRLISRAPTPPDFSSAIGAASTTAVTASSSARRRRGGLALDGARVGDGERRQRRVRDERRVPAGPAQRQRRPRAASPRMLPAVGDEQPALDRPAAASVGR